MTLLSKSVSVISHLANPIPPAIFQLPRLYYHKESLAQDVADKHSWGQKAAAAHGRMKKADLLGKAFKKGSLKPIPVVGGQPRVAPSQAAPQDGTG